MPDKKRQIRAESSISKGRMRHSDDGEWTLCSTDSGYPARLTDQRLAQRWKQIHGIGNRDILNRSWLGLICSIQCPGSVVIQTFDAIRELRDAGIVVAGGFHSPMEKECLDFLLRGDQPVIVCPAKHPTQERLPSAWRKPLDSGRLLLMSPFAGNVRRTTAEHAQTRNEFVAAMSTAVFIPHASPEGKTMGLIQQLFESQVSLFTFVDDSNTNLLHHGASPYQVSSISRLMHARDCPRH